MILIKAIAEKDGAKIMNVLVIFSHPDPKSFNAAILGVVKDELENKGAQFKIKDLYAMHWDPVLSADELAGKVPDHIAAEQRDVGWADLLVFISPVWWYSVTAIMKGYIERVMSLGFAYDHAEGGPRGLMGGKSAIFITTSGADEKTARDSGMSESMNISLVSGFGEFCGFDNVKFKNYYAVGLVSDTARKEMLADIRSLTDSMLS